MNNIYNCFFCSEVIKRTSKGAISRKGAIYLSPEEIREEINKDFKGKISEINKVEIGVFAHKRCYQKALRNLK